MDHISSAGIVGRKTGCQIYLPTKSYEAKESLFKDCTVNTIDGGNSFEVGEFNISAFSTRHDSKASVGYVLEEKSTMKKFGFLTDTGTVTKLMRDALSGCNAYFVESDYDEEELEKCAEYDEILKDRIRNPFGHLSNQQSLDFINTYVDLNSTSWVAMGHLSKHTNSPEVLRGRIEYKIPKVFWDKIHIISEPLELII